MEKEIKEKIKDTIIVVLAVVALIILILSVVTAESIYSGEEVTIPIGFEIVNCSVINNTENLEGLNLSWQSENIIISTHPLYKSDNLTISCLVIKYGEVVEYSSGGGSSCRPNKDFNWNCSEWGECIGGIKTRNCKEYNNCYNNYGRPNITESCSMPEEPIIVEPVIEPTTITYPKSNLNLYIIIALIIMGGIITAIVIIKRRRKNNG